MGKSIMTMAKEMFKKDPAVKMQKRLEEFIVAHPEREQTIDQQNWVRLHRYDYEQKVKKLKEEAMGKELEYLQKSMAETEEKRKLATEKFNNQLNS